MCTAVTSVPGARKPAAGTRWLPSAVHREATVGTDMAAFDGGRCRQVSGRPVRSAVHRPGADASELPVVPEAANASSAPERLTSMVRASPLWHSAWSRSREPDGPARKKRQGPEIRGSPGLDLCSGGRI
ncbi:hypothetical protein GCM10023066_32930 [Nocardioides kongjuensis]